MDRLCLVVAEVCVMPPDSLPLAPIADDLGVVGYNLNVLAHVFTNKVIEQLFTTRASIRRRLC